MVPGRGGTFGGANANLLGTAVLPLNTGAISQRPTTASTLRLYVNGTQVASAPRTGALTASPIRWRSAATAFLRPVLPGLIDEVRIYNVALAPSQIQADMELALGGATPVATLSRSSIDFGSVATGSSSGVQSVTLTNSGTAP